MTRLFLPFLLSLSLFLLAPLPAQDALRGAQRDLAAAFKKGSVSAQIQAVEAFVGCGDPKGVLSLLELVTKQHEEVASKRTRYDKVTAELQDAQAKWVDSKVRNGQIAQAALVQAQEKLAPLEKELATLNQQLEESERVLARLRSGVGELVANLDGESKSTAAALLVKDLGRSRKPEPRSVVLSVLGRVDHPQVRAALIEEVLSSPVPALRIAALDALGRHPDKDSERAALHSLNDEAWTVRAAAIALLSVTGGKDAVQALIDALEKEEGRLIGDVIATLRVLTKADFHDNVTLWREWWAKSQGTFSGFGKEAAVAGAEPASGAASRKKGAYFYGIETRSKNIIFILDVSGSMRWGTDVHWSSAQGGAQPSDAPAGKRKVDFAKQELIQAIAGLPDDATFNIITFSTELVVWQKKMQTAKPTTKAAARKWIEAIDANGATNLWDALERAFAIAGRGTFDRGYEPAADTIFILSDGDPNRGRITDKGQILREVSELNNLRKLAIHCVGLGPNEQVDYIAFLVRLAKENGGQFALKQR